MVNLVTTNAGYTSYKIRKEQIINQTALQKLREGKMIAWEQFNISRVVLFGFPLIFRDSSGISIRR